MQSEYAGHACAIPNALICLRGKVVSAPDTPVVALLAQRVASVLVIALMLLDVRSHVRNVDRLQRNMSDRG